MDNVLIIKTKIIVVWFQRYYFVVKYQTVKLNVGEGYDGGGGNTMVVVGVETEYLPDALVIPHFISVS